MPQLNKECFVIAGHVFMEFIKAGSTVIPIDSEHSALLQASLSGSHSEISRLILTASGGPFFNKDIDPDKITRSLPLPTPTGQWDQNNNRFSNYV